jgi:hypothetical protein
LSGGSVILLLSCSAIEIVEIEKTQGVSFFLALEKEQVPVRHCCFGESNNRLLLSTWNASGLVLPTFFDVIPVPEPFQKRTNRRHFQDHVKFRLGTSFCL